MKRLSRDFWLGFLACAVLGFIVLDYIDVPAYTVETKAVCT